MGEKYNIAYSGLVELIENAMVDMPVSYMEEAPVVEEVATTDKEALV